MDFSKNRVILVYPASDIEQMSLIPLPLLYIAQPLLEDNIEVKILDQRYEKDFFGELGRQIDSDLICIGISCMTGPQIEQVTKISGFIKERTDTPVVLGGPHPTLLIEQTLASGLIDYVVAGRGEAPFLCLVRALKMNESLMGLKQIGYKKNGRIFVNRGSMPEINVRSIPYHLILKYGKPSVIPIVSSYGCPFHCSFCVVRLLHPKYSEVPTHDVLFMIEDALKFKPQLINFIDDNFLLNIKRATKLLFLCQQNNYNFHLICTGRIDEVLSMDDETLRFMRKRGLIGIFFGIESGSTRILKMINKRITPKMVLELNLRLKKEKIMPHYSFMAGFPTETNQDMEKTIILINRLKQDNEDAVIWKINKYTPYPGTELFDLAVQNGFKPPEKFEEWTNVHFYSEEYSVPYNLHL